MVVPLHRGIDHGKCDFDGEECAFSLQGCIRSKIDCLVHGKCGFDGSKCVATSKGCEKVMIVVNLDYVVMKPITALLPTRDKRAKTVKIPVFVDTIK